MVRLITLFLALVGLLTIVGNIPAQAMSYPACDPPATNRVTCINEDGELVPPQRIADPVDEEGAPTMPPTDSTPPGNTPVPPDNTPLPTPEAPQPDSPRPVRPPLDFRLLTDPNSLPYGVTVRISWSVAPGWYVESCGLTTRAKTPDGQTPSSYEGLKGSECDATGATVTKHMGHSYAISLRFRYDAPPFSYYGAQTISYNTPPAPKLPAVPIKWTKRGRDLRITYRCKAEKCAPFIAQFHGTKGKKRDEVPAMRRGQRRTITYRGQAKSRRVIVWDKTYKLKGGGTVKPIGSR